MKIQYASDLHLEYIEKYFPDYRGVAPTAADVLVLAGDIANGTRALALFNDWPCPVIYVPGNHEYFGTSIAQLDQALAAQAAQYPNIHVLNCDTCIVHGVRFIGCTLWTDYRLFGDQMQAAAMQRCACALPDFEAIELDGIGRFTPQHAGALHMRHRRWLANCLAEDFAGKTVVVTHHAPARGSLHASYANDLTSAAFASDLHEINGIANLHIHGHTHQSFDYHLAGTRILSNPSGYMGGVKAARTPADFRPENQGFDSRRVIEL